MQQLKAMSTLFVTHLSCLVSLIRPCMTELSQFGSHRGPRRFLDDAEETELVNFLCGAARMGFARSKKEVICIVEEVIVAKGRSQMVGGNPSVGDIHNCVFEQLRSFLTLASKQLILSLQGQSPLWEKRPLIQTQREAMVSLFMGVFTPPPEHAIHYTYPYPLLVLTGTKKVSSGPATRGKHFD